MFSNNGSRQLVQSIKCMINIASRRTNARQGDSRHRHSSLAIESLEDRRVLSPLHDFGDAPSPYPTLQSQNGASHSLQKGLYLGERVDAEQDGLPDILALGDDKHDGLDLSLRSNSNPDDDDGLVFISSLAPGRAARADIVATNHTRPPAYIYAWLDSNRDGVWSQAEQIISGVQLGATVDTYQIFFAVPPGAKEGPTYLRIRLTTLRSGLEPHGDGGLGEVEDYLVQIGDRGVDYADLPDSYGTTLANDGARHIQDPSRPYYLGAGVDPDPDGQPSTNALGDDQDVDGDDEDGVLLRSGRFAPGETLEFVVAGTTPLVGQPSMRLHGWIDWNGDGILDDPAENIIKNSRIISGGAVYQITVALNANLPADIYARFRYASVTNLPPTGIAPDGEVEDYQYRRGVFYVDGRVIGDSNLDEVFDIDDLVQVLQANKYLNSEPATFADGDWDGDGVFNQHDLVLALASGNLRQHSFGRSSPAKGRNTFVKLNDEFDGPAVDTVLSASDYYR